MITQDEVQQIMSHTLPYLTSLKSLHLKAPMVGECQTFDFASGVYDGIFKLKELDELELKFDCCDVESSENFFNNLASNLPQLRVVHIRKYQVFPQLFINFDFRRFFKFVFNFYRRYYTQQSIHLVVAKSS